MIWPFASRTDSITRRPLLSPPQLVELRRAVKGGLPWPQGRELRQPQLGERPSQIRGTGLDYDESRPFLPGDDRRHINWRLYARSGELHLKLFREERRPQLCLMLDRRQAMRQGSRRRLKLTQAARLAVMLASMAEADAMAVGALCLEAPGQFHRARSGERALADLLRVMTAAAPPLGRLEEPPLSRALAQLQTQLPRGSRIALISDFADLHEQDAGLLWQLVREHDVAAFHISDALEHALPTSGRLRLASAGGAILEVDCRDGQLREAYAREMRARHEAIRQCLEGAGVSYTALRSDASLSSVLYGGTGDEA